MLFTHVVGARPNFMKAAPVLAALMRRGWRQSLVHTGQHYDELMSDVLFKQLQLPAPDINLGVGSGSHAQQTGAVLMAVERLLIQQRPDIVVVYGDVNSTMAAALAAAKLQVPVAHIEAGVRSFDRSMPEEINRIVTDQLASYLFTPSAESQTNLVREGADADRIFNVGNVMIDTLQRCLPLADPSAVLDRVGLRPEDPFMLTTLHRASNVDNPVLMAALVEVLSEIAKRVPVVFPVHPRTRMRIAGLNGTASLHLLEPVGYLEFLGLQSRARLVLTDSGGVQAETTYLGVPCVTARANTEWPETIKDGTNVLGGTDPADLLRAVLGQLSTPRQSAKKMPPLWDGHAAERIADVFERTAPA